MPSGDRTRRGRGHPPETMQCCASGKRGAHAGQRLPVRAAAADEPTNAARRRAQTVGRPAPEGALAAELMSMRVSALRQRVLDAGLSEDKVDLAEDSADPRAALVWLLFESGAQADTEDGASQTAAAAEAALRVELADMQPSALRRRAAKAGVAVAELNAATDSDNPAAALVELLVNAARPGPGNSGDARAPSAAALVAEMQGLRLSELRRRAEEAGVVAAELDEIEDSADPKGGLIARLVNASAPRAGRAPAAREPDRLRQELEELGLAALLKRARFAEGVDEEQLAAAVDDESPKARLIALLVENRRAADRYVLPAFFWASRASRTLATLPFVRV